MADIKSMNRRLDRINAASGGNGVRVIWRNQGEELPDDIDPDSDDVLIICWKVGGDDSDYAEPPQPEA